MNRPTGDRSFGADRMASPEYTDSPDPWAGLGPWGWDDLTRRRFEAAALGGEQPARVLRADRGACVVALCDGERHLPIDKRLGSDSEERPTTGDWAVVRGGEVIAVLERRTAVVRAAADPSGKPQVLAANVDNVLLLEPLTDRWRPRRLERLLVIAWQSGARPIVVLTKADLVASVDEALAKAMSVAPGVSVHAVSSVEGLGIDRLLADLAPGTTAVVLGRSGAGKSTLSNLLSAGDGDLATQSVRGDGKGRHTTVTRELVQLENGSLFIDTPGLRSIGLVDAEEALSDAFSDVDELSKRCRFHDCAHGSEPDCAVRAAISAGDLDKERFESYERLLRDQQRLAAREDPRLRAEQTAERRAFAREQKRQSHR